MQGGIFRTVTLIRLLSASISPGFLGVGRHLLLFDLKESAVYNAHALLVVVGHRHTFSCPGRKALQITPGKPRDIDSKRSVLD